eukprot:s4_g42.t1
MPASVLLAVLSVCLLWGWLSEAAILALTRAGILRIGESLPPTACRRDLVLPDDAAPGTCHALLRIKEPKTRGKHARHQAARIDPSDIVALLEIAYGSLSSDAMLWPLSATTLRKRLVEVMSALKPPPDTERKLKQFDLTSLRPGGASWLLSCSEDSELVRRRGRWATTKTMEIYLQEVLYITYVERLPRDAKEAITTCAAGFPEMLEKAKYFVRSGIPCSTWYSLLRNRWWTGNQGVNGHCSCFCTIKPGCRSLDLCQQHGKVRACILSTSCIANQVLPLKNPAPMWARPFSWAMSQHGHSAAAFAPSNQGAAA